jgi:AcrR family transcriptional regulator
MSRLPARERREQLLDTAAELFAKHGYARATTAQLAKAAGVTEPIIYRHFSSKRDLFVALIERTGERTLAMWEEHLAESTEPAERLKRLINDNPMVTRENRDAYRVILQAISEVEDDDGIKEALSEHMKSLQAFLSKELTEAQAAGRVPDRFSADVLAWVMISMGMGYGALVAMGIPGAGRDSQGKHVRDVIAAAMINLPKPGSGSTPGAR